MRNKSVGVGIIGLGDEVVTLLKKFSIETSKYTDIKPNPDCFGVDKAAEVAETMDPAVKSLSFREKAEKCAELVERLFEGYKLYSKVW